MTDLFARVDQDIREAVQKMVDPEARCVAHAPAPKTQCEPPWFDTDIHLGAVAVGREVATALLSQWLRLKALGWKAPKDLVPLLLARLDHVTTGPEK